MKSSELSNGENLIALRQLLQNRKLRHLWRHNLGSRQKLQKMARENFSIGAFYNVTKNPHNSIKTVGRDSFWAPKPLKIQVLGVTQPQGSHSPYILGDTTRPRHITSILVWSKLDQRRLRKTLHKQTDKDRHYENNGHLAVNQYYKQNEFLNTICVCNQTGGNGYSVKGSSMHIITLVREIINWFIRQ